jgi:hypothetical protein
MPVMLRITGSILFAAQTFPRPPSAALAFVVLVGVIVGGLLTVYFLKREDEDDAEPVSDDDILKEFERARYAGEMDEEEFQRVCAVLNQKKTHERANPARASTSNAPADEPDEPKAPSGEPDPDEGPAPASGEP